MKIFFHGISMPISLIFFMYPAVVFQLSHAMSGISKRYFFVRALYLFSTSLRRTLVLKVILLSRNTGQTAQSRQTGTASAFACVHLPLHKRLYHRKTARQKRLAIHNLPISITHKKFQKIILLKLICNCFTNLHAYKLKT